MKLPWSNITVVLPKQTENVIFYVLLKLYQNICIEENGNIFFYNLKKQNNFEEIEVQSYIRIL